MAYDINAAFANALLDRLDTELPAGSVCEIRTGAPAGPDSAATGTLLASITLPATPWAAASASTKAKQGTWAAAAGAAGVAGHFRLRNTGGTRILEGTISGTGGGGDMILDNTNIASGQTVTVATLTVTL